MHSRDRLPFDDVWCEMSGQALSVANLSLGGFFVACDPPPARGQAVAFELVFRAGKRIPAVGRVAWVNDTGAVRNPALPIGCGITITRIAFPDKLAIVGLLRRAQATRPRPEP